MTPQDWEFIGAGAGYPAEKENLPAVRQHQPGDRRP